MKHRSTQGFTLLEVLAVVVIILVIASWIVSAAATANKRAAAKRAESEIKDMEMACEHFKTEYGTYPRFEKVTEPSTDGEAPIDPQRDGNPNSDAYKKSTEFLYRALSGDENLDNKLSPPAEVSKGYMDFQSNNRMLGGTKDKNGKITKVQYLQDPFGNSYGYCTAGAKLEDDFKAQVQAKGKDAKRPETTVGFNSSFDLWSTGGKVTTGTVSDSDRNGWVKNW